MTIMKSCNIMNILSEIFCLQFYKNMEERKNGI